MRHVCGIVAMLLPVHLLIAPGEARSDDKPKPATKIEFYAAFKESADGLVKKVVAGHGREKESTTVYLDPKPAITTEDVQEAKPGVDNSGELCITIGLTEAGGVKMQKLSKQQMGKLIALVIDDAVITAPTVRSEMTRLLQMTGAFDEEWVLEVVSKFERP